ncbi:hypothetical protein [Bacillus thuringiensis]|uniref:hypothetical protein n=1 Tax=Bacillus thuringiensis TaxID=1428 RepID=UPI000A3C0C6D|nr:hypothetical protein [Bacillus thuringiensis]OTZ47847.1 hypothetical protein BK762_19365 [Bacillus thuringiensis serovar toumanoffi]
MSRGRMDLKGRVSGKLTVKKDKGDYLECLCECGNTKDIVRTKFTSRKAKHCGCRTKKLPKGTCQSKIYNVWANIRTRTMNENHPQYKDYGGRGIKLCDEWNDEIMGSRNFIAWSKISGYKEGLTIDRKDVDGDYSPENCRWVDMYTQTRNRRSNVKYTFNGVTLTATDWSYKLGGERSLVRNRINAGWSVERALTTPV